MNSVMIIPQALRLNPPNIDLTQVLSFCRPHPAPVRKLKQTKKQRNKLALDLPVWALYGISNSSATKCCVRSRV